MRKTLLGKRNKHVGFQFDTSSIGLGITIDIFRKTDSDFDNHQIEKGTLITVYLFCFQLLIAI